MKLLNASAIAVMIASGPTLAGTNFTGGSDQTDLAHGDLVKFGMTDLEMMKGELVRGRDLVGSSVFTAGETSTPDWDRRQVHDTVDESWTEIGEVEDVILTRGGQVVGIVAEVGGFLDIADKHVVIPIKDLGLVSTEDGDHGYVTHLSKDALETRKDVDQGYWN